MTAAPRPQGLTQMLGGLVLPLGILIIIAMMVLPLPVVLLRSSVGLEGEAMASRIRSVEAG